MLHYLSSVWVLSGYNSSLWGKLYSEWHLTPHRQEQCAVILHCFHLADFLTSLWGLGQTGERPQKPEHSRWGARGSVLLHALPPSATAPMSLCCQHIQLQGVVWHVRRWANNEYIDRDACALAELVSLSWQSHRPMPTDKNQALEGWKQEVIDPESCYYPETMKSRENNTKLLELCQRTTWGKSNEKHLQDVRL